MYSTSDIHFLNDIYKAAIIASSLCVIIVQSRPLYEHPIVLAPFNYCSFCAL